MKNYCDPYQVGDIYGTSLDCDNQIVSFYRYRNKVYKGILKVDLKKNVLFFYLCIFFALFYLCLFLFFFHLFILFYLIYLFIIQPTPQSQRSQDSKFTPSWDSFVPSLTFIGGEIQFLDYDNSETDKSLKWGKQFGYNLILSTAPKDFEIYMCNSYFDKVEERMGEDYYFWSFSKEFERTYLKYFRYDPVAINTNHKLEDVL